MFSIQVETPKSTKKRYVMSFINQSVIIILFRTRKETAKKSFSFFYHNYEKFSYGYHDSLNKTFLTGERQVQKKKVKFMNIHDLNMANYIIGGNVEIVFIQFSLEKKK